MRPRGALIGVAAAAVAAEGGVREPDTDISSLDELRGVLVRVTPAGFEPEDVVVQAGDSVSWKNTDPEEHRIRKVDGQGADFTSRLLSRRSVYQRTFPKPGKVTVEVDTKPKSRMVVTVFKR